MKTVLITGASRGIGRAIALRFAKENKYRLFLNSRTGGAALEATVRLAEELGSQAFPVPGDVSDPDFVRNMVEQAGPVDILINNAGRAYISLVQDMSPDDWMKVISTDLSSVHYTCSAIIPGMLKSGSGRIINISSVWGNIGASCEAAYSAAKGGVNSYTKALAKELAPSHIAVNAIACGIIDTDMNSCFSKEELEEICEDIPSGRLGTPQEVAELVYSVSCQSDYLTGQIITIDGGWT